MGADNVTYLISRGANVAIIVKKFQSIPIIIHLRIFVYLVGRGEHIAPRRVQPDAIGSARGGQLVHFGASSRLIVLGLCVVPGTTRRHPTGSQRIAHRGEHVVDHRHDGRHTTLAVTVYLAEGEGLVEARATLRVRE